MAKKYLTVNEKVGTIEVSEFDSSVTEIIEQMQYLVERYGEDVYLDYDYNYDEYGAGQFEVRRRRTETDDERDKRLAAARKERDRKRAAKEAKEAKERDRKRAAKEAKEAKEREEYERLRAKFDPDA